MKLQRMLIAAMLMASLGREAAAQITATIQPVGYLNVQGLLHENGAPVNGFMWWCWDFYDAPTGGNLLAHDTNMNRVLVSNGVANVTSNIGDVAALGLSPTQDLYLQLDVSRTGEPGSFTVLNPRQRIVPSLFATLAVRAEEARRLIEPLPAALMPKTVSTLTFMDKPVFGAASGPPFAVSSSALVPFLNADELDGYDSSAFWKLEGNGGTTAGTDFLGTTDDEPLELKVNNLRALRLEPHTESPNLIGGAAANSVAATAVGATISGGGSAGASSQPNTVQASYSTISGGRGHQVGASATEATISGGQSNLVEQSRATIGGGAENTVSTWGGTISGGFRNTVEQDAFEGVIGGGYTNRIKKDSWLGIIGGGTHNAIEEDVRLATIAGGGTNVIRIGSAHGAIGGGSYTFSDTVGQPVLGAMSGGGFAVQLGFRAQAAAAPQPSLDLKLVANRTNVLTTENQITLLTLTASNQGPSTATSVQLLANLPDGFRTPEATNSAGTCQVTSNSVICTVPSLPPNSAFTVDLTVRPRFLPESSNLSEEFGNLTASVGSAEVELNPSDNSLVLPVIVRAQTDWPDARGGFPVTAAEDGAFHRYSTNAPWLGTRWDNETPTGVHSPLADWDDTHGSGDDEDGLAPSPIIPGTVATVIVTCTNTDGFLDAWADFNNDGDWDDSGERTFGSRHLVVGANTLTFDVPASAVPGLIMTRWRVSISGGLSYTGYGGVGEVEDHQVGIQAAPVDLRVALQNVPIEAEIAGQPFHYGVTVSNAASNGATGVSLIVAHQGPAVSDISVGGGDGCQVVGNEVRCGINALPIRQAARFDIAVTPQARGKLIIRAMVAASGAEFHPEDNLAEGLTPVIWNVQECACSCYTNAPRPVPDPLLTSWFTKNSGQWAKAVLTNGDPARVYWNSGPNDPNPYEVIGAYADVQKIQEDGTFVYISGNGLASYTMGPWMCEPGNFFPEWPTKQTNPAKIPFAPDVSVCDETKLDAIGLWVNGTAVYNMLDGYHFVSGRDQPDSGMQSADDNMPPGSTGVWNRDAWFSEKTTFDPAYFHTAQHQYHSHAGPELLRVQLGDNQWPIYGPVRVDGTKEILGYVEQPNPALWHHSPILGWAFDGHPIYGPYGYSDPDDPTSGIRRMRSGYVKRDGANGTTDLTATASGTGRTTLPTWKRLLLGLTTSTLASTDYGPSTDRSLDTTPCNDIDFAIGRYAEDNAFMGHLINPADVDWFHQGEDFDLDLHNGRCCKTPEFPNGTYAYFVTISDDAAGTPVFPYVLGWQYCGKQRGSENANTNGASTYFSAEHPRFNPVPLPAFSAGTVTLQWDGRQGATYRLRSSDDLQHWTIITPPILSNETTHRYAVPLGPNPPPRLFFDVLLERDGDGQLPGIAPRQP